MACGFSGSFPYIADAPKLSRKAKEDNGGGGGSLLGKFFSSLVVRLTMKVLMVAGFYLALRCWPWLGSHKDMYCCSYYLGLGA